MRTYNHQYNDTLKCDNVIYFPVSFTASKFPLASANVTYIDTKLNDVSNEIQDEDTNTADVWKIQENDDKSEVCKSLEKITTNNKRDHVVFKINAPQDELQSFGVWGRIYTRDVDHNKDVSEEDMQTFNNILDLIYDTSDKHTTQ